MRAVYLALKDLLQILRDWKAAFFLIIMPIAFTLLFGFAFGGFVSDEESDPRLPVGVVDQDQGMLGQHLLSLLASSDIIRPETRLTSDAEAEELVSSGDLTAAIIVPPGFANHILAEDTRPLTIIIEGDNGARPAIQGEVLAVVMRLKTAVQAAEISTQLYKEKIGFSDNDVREAYFQDTLVRAITAWQEPPINIESRETRLSQPDKTEEEQNSFAQTSPGMMAQFSIAGLMGASAVLVLERKNRSMQRLLTTPITRGEILFGHFLAMFVMIFTQLLILIIFAQLFLRLDYFGRPLASMLMVITTALFAASLGLLIGAIAKSEEQVIVFALIPMFVLAALGGAWVPLEITPIGFQRIARLTPVAWVMEGFQDIVIRGQGLEAVWLAAVVLSGYALVLFAIAVWQFRYE
jgi:ABC-2 type transport system permease protein